jgi:hypothetical protein
MVLATACSREVAPEGVAQEYARALYARDLSRAYAMISSQDRRWKSEEEFVAEGEGPSGNALELARHLASYIEVASAQKTMTADRAEVKLKLRLPDANAPVVAGLVRDWDEAALNALPPGEEERIRRELDRLHRSGRLPVLDGEETFALVKEAEGWRVVVDWAEAIRVRFRTRIPEGIPLMAEPQEQELLVRAGEPVEMTVRLTNGLGRELSMRVSHEIEPEAAAPALVFLHCPLLLPVKLAPGATKEISSSFMVADSLPNPTRTIQVTFGFRPGE